MRLMGEEWEEIAAALAVSVREAMTRALRIGAGRSPRGPKPSEDPAREPLPAGHPRSWNALTRGTWLAGTPYPQGEER
jgi:hypothetical protein